MDPILSGSNVKGTGMLVVGTAMDTNVLPVRLIHVRPDVPRPLCWVDADMEMQEDSLPLLLLLWSDDNIRLASSCVESTDE
mmetsp:Transcript_32385/g.47583  ORF Transcript_32385/g.47583 Transcript_32385/m.47583 type:complete len:81 (-) Transcript_32385:35-277(-)